MDGNLIVGISAFIVSFITLIVVLWSERGIQLNLLRGLYQHLDKIKESAPSQYDYMEKTNRVPSWTLINLDLNYYLSHINHVIKREGFFSFQKICTKELKQQIINIVDKINNINNLFSVMYMAESNCMSKVVTLYTDELKNNSYYKDLNEYIYKAEEQLKLILKKKKFCSKTFY